MLIKTDNMAFDRLARLNCRKRFRRQPPFQLFKKRNSRLLSQARRNRSLKQTFQRTPLIVNLVTIGTHFHLRAVPRENRSDDSGGDWCWCHRNCCAYRRVIERNENLKARINKTELSLAQLIRAREHFWTWVIAWAFEKYFSPLPFSRCSPGDWPTRWPHSQTIASRLISRLHLVPKEFLLVTETWNRLGVVRDVTTSH